MYGNKSKLVTDILVDSRNLLSIFPYCAMSNLLPRDFVGSSKQFKKACHEGDFVTLKSLMNRGVVWKPKWMITICKNNRIDVVNWLIDHDFVCELSVRSVCAVYNRRGYLPIEDYKRGLYGACYGGHKDLIDMFVTFFKAIPPQYYTLGEDYPWNDGLYGAAQGGQIDIAKEMMKMGANDYYEATIFACGAGQLAMAKWLKTLLPLQKDHDYDHEWGYSNPLWTASRGNHTNVIEWLLSDEFTPRVDVNRGLWGACEGGHRQLAERMMELGATDIKGALVMAHRGKQQKIIEWLNVIDLPEFDDQQ